MLSCVSLLSCTVHYIHTFLLLPLQVSEAPYRPFRSPSREDLPAEPIPEVDVEAATEEVLLVVKQLDTELAQQAPPTEGLGQSEAGEGGAPLTAVNQEPVGVTPGDEEIKEDTQQENAEPRVETIEPEQQPADTEQPEQPASESEVQPEPAAGSTFPTAAAAKCCRILTLTFLLMFTVMSLVALFVLESELDMPVLRDIRQMPEVQDFKYQHYNPFKTTVAQKMGKWFK